MERVERARWVRVADECCTFAAAEMSSTSRWKALSLVLRERHSLLSDLAVLFPAVLPIRGLAQRRP